MIAAWQGDLVALETLTSSVPRSALRHGPPTWCVRVTTRLGLPDANRFRDLAIILTVPSESLANLEIVDDPTILAAAGSPAQLYGVHAYRRFIPWDMLSPSLPHFAVE